MGGVDHFDERRGRYNVSRRSKKWWMCILDFFIDSTIVNAFILFNSVRPDNAMTMLQFRESLFLELSGSYTSRRRRSSLDGAQYIGRRKNKSTMRKRGAGVPDEIRFKSVGIHMPQLISSFRRCRNCSSRKNSKRSRIVCSTCGGCTLSYPVLSWCPPPITRDKWDYQTFRLLFYFYISSIYVLKHSKER